MSRGILSDHFTGVVFKTLSAVETNLLTSNQHEYNGTSALKRVLGPGQPVTFRTRFLLLADEGEPVIEDGALTWYDARENNPKRSEYRLYFPTNAVTAGARAGDGLFIARRPDDQIMVIVAPAGSTVLSQLLWLFGMVEERGLDFEAREYDLSAPETGFVSRLILEQLGIEAEGADEDRFDALIDRFGLTFPSTRAFSAFARETLPEVDPLDDPDAALLAWLEREEQLFRRLERRIVHERIKAGFSAGDDVDVDGFLSFSLSVQNRRKSRAGHSLENHLETVFPAFNIEFQRGAETENRNRPDFLFPGAAAYHDTGFPADRLLMLGSKTTCKDRWRQVLSEAERIPDKHLLTLEPGISVMQTDEMAVRRLTLVLPKALHGTFRESQRPQLMDLAGFINVASQRQRQPQVEL
ncbi:hypothetical protein QE419_000911 [Brevundimonas vesicularis]|uniref:type II restriction endonuclease n=1 Tax=Brevundimonas vesicularis TaxID=41276 RepID=UPI0027851AB8|nr:type II restriction endonuclease [Brevundimonas vesicularis]MDQ1192145.1 hypothetical protein [Brevundimonas vesicularis]